MSLIFKSLDTDQKDTVNILLLLQTRTECGGSGKDYTVYVMAFKLLRFYQESVFLKACGVRFILFT